MHQFWQLPRYEQDIEKKALIQIFKYYNFCSMTINTSKMNATILAIISGEEYEDAIFVAYTRSVLPHKKYFVQPLKTDWNISHSILMCLLF